MLGDIASVSDEKIEGIHKRMSEEKLKTYKEKLEAENPDLLAKLFPLDPEQPGIDKNLAEDNGDESKDGAPGKWTSTD